MTTKNLQDFENKNKNKKQKKKKKNADAILWSKSHKLDLTSNG